MGVPEFLTPQWPAPANVKSCITTRRGGVSLAPYSEFNLALHVGDDTEAVTKNRNALQSALGVDDIQWLEQVHGTKLIEAQADNRVRTADASYTRTSGVVCSVMTADCLPVLLCDSAGTQVAAVHAGWRGLADGVIAEALGSFQCDADQILAYFGPAISSDAFEVGIDVLEAFFESARNEEHLQRISECFSPSSASAMKYQADIYALARAELSVLGVTRIYGGDTCTYKEQERFYSYRREGVTGRMATLIWLD